MSQYDPTLSLDRDKVRFLVGDTDNDHQMLEDGEIAFLLTEEGNDVYLASSRACETLAARFARDVNYRFSTMWQDAGDAYEHYMGLAKEYRLAASETASVAPEFLMSNVLQRRIDDDEGIEEFWYGMHDNPPETKTED